MYPRIVIETNQIISNTKKMVELAKANHIDYVMAVVKVFAGHFDFVNQISSLGITHIGDSRIENLMKLKSIKLPKLLVRLPMISESASVVKYADVSLNSELKTIQALDQEARKQNKKHQIILMFDLGDLREGIYHSSDYLSIIHEILALKHIHLLGIGTNLTCYGGLVPSADILERLVTVKNHIEKTFDIKLEIISGGNSSTVTLFGKNIIPKEINSLRLGESIFFGKETSYSSNIEGFFHDNYYLEVEIIECQYKRSYPEGETSINSFGESVQIEDKGFMNRAILAIGKQDVMLNNLFPIDHEIEIIGGSSDHLIVDLGNSKYQVGDILRFQVNYPGLLHLMNSPYVKKFFK